MAPMWNLPGRFAPLWMFSEIYFSSREFAPRRTFTKARKSESTVSKLLRIFGAIHVRHLLSRSLNCIVAFIETLFRRYDPSFAKRTHSILIDETKEILCLSE